MPTYDYKCKSCLVTFEMNKKISDRDSIDKDVCPECLSVGNIERQLSSPLIGYSISVNGGYGSSVPEGFKDVLRKIDEKSPGSRMKETSAFI